MERENKKQAVAAVHRKQIMAAAEDLFSEKGFAQTTIADISQAAAYSRRTIYAYFESKEDILHHIIAKGLQSLKQNIENDLRQHTDFTETYFAICRSMRQYQIDCPHSAAQVTRANTEQLDLRHPAPIVRQIMSLGMEINDLLAAFIADGKAQCLVRQAVAPMQTVYVLWSSITSLLTLVQTKGPYLAAAFSMTEDAFLTYGLTQIINSILEVRI